MVWIFCGVWMLQRFTLIVFSGARLVAMAGAENQLLSTPFICHLEQGLLESSLAER